ncbi:hypothetical protein AK812_SmicGene33452 [Symbiodinium microadriaticum]|uniref:Uncharacterized protein n=1 Tax=Symbiodinium microadriaticum TaxID=2951 RepID=A0A1Q9CRL4_SYMMI|nr:hypothetical protein AK812_SmicGene33452 [Symbiodinium microadriaticum]CAE7346882.1 unnamed protein product [Symbiodinium microadriaticum]CAE7363775.1 unnamed protein product [Symbiodinium sp. KB8]
MARSCSPTVRLRTRGTAGIDDIFLSPLTTEEKQRLCLEAEKANCRDGDDSGEEASSSSVDMEEHAADSLQRVSVDDIQDYSQLDVSSSDFADGSSPEFAGMPAYVEQLKQETAELEDLRCCSVPFYHSKQLRFKWGGCPYHERRSLQPHGGDQRCESKVEHLGFEKIAAAVVAYQNFYQDTISPKDLWEQTSFLHAQAS